jgi:hypothetical protein
LNTATLIDSGTAGHGAPADDFNWSMRPVNVEWDVGAYEWSQNTNPGWQIQGGYKEINVAVRETESWTVDHPQRVNIVITKNLLLFENLSSKSRISVYDILGRLVHDSGLITQSKYKVSISEIPCGIYFYVVQTGSLDLTQMGKFVVVR